jgi:hypothetical protein
MRGLVKVGVVLSCLVLLPAAAFAQAGLAGNVKDSSGAVLPGVTVEAASPALIEKTRSVVTDGSGNYKIENVRPGTYSVTFTLPGFNTVKRDGIELAGSFVATVNADMKVGAIEETITVTGETPNLAARLQALAGPDEIVVGLTTQRLVGASFEYLDLGHHVLKGIAEPVRAWRVLRAAKLEGRFEATREAGALTPLVGREEELSLLQRRWAQAKAGEALYQTASNELLPDDVARGSISTVPLGPRTVDRSAACDGLASAADGLAAVAALLAGSFHRADPAPARSAWCSPCCCSTASTSRPSCPSTATATRRKLNSQPHAHRSRIPTRRRSCRRSPTA